jgi:hypothetical protein
MAGDSDLEFQYYLADRLGRTRAELLDTMSSAEYVDWTVYHGRKAQRTEMAQKLAAQGR